MLLPIACITLVDLAYSQLWVILDHFDREKEDMANVNFGRVVYIVNKMIGYARNENVYHGESFNATGFLQYNADKDWAVRWFD